MIKLKDIIPEEIKIPIDIGDTVYMGKFKNKKVVVKDISWNDKGDLLINGRPAMKMRIPPKQNIFQEQNLHENDTKNIPEYDVKTEDNQCFIEWLTEKMKSITAAEYQVRKVKLNKPMQGDVKKFKVYVKNPKGNVVKVNFGQGGGAKGGTMRIRKNNPKARKSFRARHNCDNPGPKHKARYWSCKKW